MATSRSKRRLHKGLQSTGQAGTRWRLQGPKGDLTRAGWQYSDLDFGVSVEQSKEPNFQLYKADFEVRLHVFVDLDFRVSVEQDSCSQFGVLDPELNFICSNIQAKCQVMRHLYKGLPEDHSDSTRAN